MSRMHVFLEFENPIRDLEGRIEELRQLGVDPGDKDAAKPAVNAEEEIARLQTKVAQLIADTYAKLTPWQKTLVARHPARPHFSDYAARLVADFTPLAGDRLYGEDKAIVAGLGRFRGQAVAIVGHEKGNDTKSRLKHNFGMAMPEGYRKVLRLFEMANRFGLPVLSLVDTAGAYPGIGEGGSGGAVAIAAANKVLMLEHSIYSVISPEGCASILWHKSEKASDAAAAMKITAQDLLGLHVIDAIIPEPMGGAHRAPEIAIQAVGDAIEASLRELSSHGADALKRMRREKFLSIGKLENA